MEYGKPFKCAGGKEKCDIGCEILRIIIDGKTYAFGGACNKYYNIIHRLDFDEEKLDLVANRERLIFKKYAPEYEINENAKTIGINRSFYTNTYYPLYYNFFNNLGFKVITSDRSSKEGEDAALAPFCYPMLLAHGFFHNLLEKKPDYIFMPHLVQLETEGYCKDCTKERGDRKTCVFNQGEPFSLKTVFRDRINPPEMLVPLLDFSRGIDIEEDVFINLALNKLSCTKGKAKAAFKKALFIQREFLKN